MILKTKKEEKTTVETQENDYNEFYTDDTYRDGTERSLKKILIIGFIIIILILLFMLIFGGKKKIVDNNNNLKKIYIESGELEPAFDKNVLEYELKTNSSKIRIDCEAESENAKIEGCDLGEITTSELTEDIVITVKAANGEEKQYVIKANAGYEGIKVTVEGNENEWSNKEVTLKVTAEGDHPLAEEAYSFDNGVTWQKENTKVFDSDQTVKVRVKDNEGNVSIVQNVEIKIDKTAPQVEVTGTEQSGVVTDSAVTLTGKVTPTETVSGYKYQWYNGKTALEGETNLALTTSNSGNYALEVTTGAGNKSLSSVYVVKNKNSIKPTITGINGLPTGWSDSDVTVTIMATSPNDLHESAYSFDNGKTWQKESSKTFSKGASINVLVRDTKGNVSDSKKINIKIDKTTPNVSISSSTVSGGNAQMSAVVNPKSAPSGYKYQWYKDSQAISGATRNTYIATVSGSYTVRVTTGTGKTTVSRVYEFKKSVPSGGNVKILSVSGNASKWTKSNVVLKVNASASNGIHAKGYSFDNGKTWQASNSKAFGSNQTVYIKVRDKNGNISSTNKQVISRIDKIGPVVSFSPNGNATAAAKHQVKVNVKDQGITSLGKLYFALSTSSTSQPNFTATFKSGQTIEIKNGKGSYYLWIKAIDALGNVTVTKSKAFVIGSSSSSALNVQVTTYKADENGKRIGAALKTYTNPTTINEAGWQFYGRDYHIKLTSGKLKSITWKYNVMNAKDITSAKKQWNKTRTFTKDDISLGLFGSGIRVGEIVVTDTAGNSKKITVRVDVDRRQPVITFSPYKAGTFSSNKKVIATCTDDLSGVSYMYTVDAQDTTDYVKCEKKNGKFTVTADNKNDINQFCTDTKFAKESQFIYLITKGNTRNIKTECRDAVGNKATATSPNFKIN